MKLPTIHDVFHLLGLAADVAATPCRLWDRLTGKQRFWEMPDRCVPCDEGEPVDRSAA